MRGFLHIDAAAVGADSTTGRHRHHRVVGDHRLASAAQPNAETSRRSHAFDRIVVINRRCEDLVEVDRRVIASPLAQVVTFKFGKGKAESWSTVPAERSASPPRP